jgi:peptidyl-prolyl cis-trans isomerase SurA
MIYKTTGNARVRAMVRSVMLAGVITAGVTLSLPGDMSVSHAAQQGILVVVNDQPITHRDVSQRMKLNRALGGGGGSAKERKKKTLDTLINEVIARAQAKKGGVKIDDKRVTAALERMAKGSKTTVAGLEKTLKGKGVSMSTLRAQVEATLYLRWVIGKQGQTKVEVTDAEVDRRYKKITSDPRLKPVRILKIREVTLPVDASGVMGPQLLQARAIEAQQIAKRYSGCNSLRAASKGIYNVKLSKTIQAPADKMPKQMRDVLKQAGTKKLIGPMRVKAGVRMIAYCGAATLKPPKPPRDAIKNMLLNEKYEKVTGRVMKDLRRRAFIEYKDKSAIVTQ